MTLTDLIDVYEGDLHIKVPRGSSLEHIQKVLDSAREWAKIRQRRENYLQFHGPWDYSSMKCLTCGQTDAEVHNSRSVCHDHADPETRSK